MFEKGSPARDRKRIRVSILRRSGPAFVGYLFTAQNERVVDLLNDERAFLPVESLTGHVSVLQKSDICEIVPHREKREPILSSQGDPFALLGVSRSATP